MDIDTLFDSVLSLIDAGDESALRMFVAEHVNEFPEDIRDQVVMFFFKEAVSDHAEGVQAEEELLRESLGLMEELGTLKKAIEDRQAADATLKRLQG